MAFTLIHLLSGEDREFSTKDLLELLGDTVNDEIVIKGQVYRPSTLVELPGTCGSSSPMIFRTLLYEVENDETTEFIFQYQLNLLSILLTHNRKLCDYGENLDFHIDHGMLIWHGTPLLNGDRIMIRYLDFDN